MTTTDTAMETAGLLRELLAMVERGELDASSARAVALLRRIEGAAAALEAVGQDDERPGHDDHQE